MNTCVLCFRRRNAFECTIRSRSRWNGVRTALSSSGSRRIAGYERVARSHRYSSSHARVRSSSVASGARGWSAVVVKGLSSLLRDRESILSAARPRDRLEQLAGQLPGTAHVVPCDLAAEADSLAGKVADLGLEVDVLVNN